ncbi:MAG TPA: hypothetical protein VFT95_16770 [Micromonosporaceae bacterium]|nr:hypothetical protein [Micromonosporaceae bacterium]
MSMQGAPGQRVSCPDCGAQVWPEQERLCRNCGYPLMFLRPDKQEPESYGVARAPGERADSTSVLTPPPVRQPTRSYAPVPQPQTFAASAAPTAGELICPRCGHRSAPTRVRCERCGQELRATMMMPEPAESMKEPVGPRRGKGWLIVLGVFLAVALLAAGTWFLVHRERPTTPGPGPVAAPPPQTQLVPIDQATIEAAASSTNPNENRYKVASLLDGKRATAWNSNGDRLDSNVGQRVTFTFDRPVNLARVTIINGYVRTPVLFKGNERVAKMTIQTDAGKAQWDLADSDQVQTLDIQPATTNKVVLIVDAVYDGNKYKDVCITEVNFFEAR